MLFWRRRRHPIGDEELSSYVDGRLGAPARARLEAHIEACTACREALTELRALRRALGELPRAVAPRSFALREQDVRPMAAPRAVGALGRAPALLGGLAMIAFLSFWALVSVDVLTQPSEEGAATDTFQRGEGVLRGAVGELPSATPGAIADGLPSYAEEGTKAEAETAPDRERLDELSPAAPQPTPECPAAADCPEGFLAPPSPLPTLTPVPRAEAEPAGDARVPLRAGEAAAAAVALVAASSLALVWWRRRS